MLFYNLFLYILFPFAILRLFSKKEFNLSELPRIKERLGKVNLENNFQEKPIWIHAVSVGEVKVASLLIKEIKKVDINIGEITVLDVYHNKDKSELSIGIEVEIFQKYKVLNAKELKIKIIDQSQFLKMLNKTS